MKTCDKRSRQTTYKSLIGIVGCIYAETREQFEYYYKLATHDDGGCIWWYMSDSTREAKNKYQRERFQKKARSKKLCDSMNI